ncbi:MAG: UDP-3-O-(3-hydroxymyristoyl)glucosamine N-acyltransferase [Tannerella sp.]|jgi:UDP-3-O-[3-hydroxymyristoyl] glucosamine N-acyltransferase|nr:UDP-3-O-(3-hydroxymyristoyl)glucosamine N-acyltransferase [Tannerella sp.]
MKFTAQQIANILTGSITGNPDVEVSDFSKIEEGRPGTLTFLANPKYEAYIYDTKADIVLVNNDFVPSKEIRATLIKVTNAYAALAMLMNQVDQLKPKKRGIEPAACIASSAVVGENCYVGSMAYIGAHTTIGRNCQIYPHAYIGDNVTIGDDSVVYPHVAIYDYCVIGRNCILHAGSVIGSDGFGFAPEGEEYRKIPQLGNVVLEDGVEIGANTTIDRAVMGSTMIRKGVKLDNLIQIAHNVEVGENTVMAAQSGVAGSTKVGSNCMLGGQVGLAGHLKIVDQVKFGAQAGVHRSIEKPGVYIGTPVQPVRDFYRNFAYANQLPELERKIRRLQKEIEELKNIK